jgi:GAF domain-containing protein
MGEGTGAGQVLESVAVQEATRSDVRRWQEQLVQGILRAVAIVGFLVAAFATYDSYINEELWTIPFYWGSYAIVILLTLWHKAPYALRVWGIIGLVYVIGFVDFVQEGQAGSARIFMLTMPFLAGLLLGLRASVSTLMLGALTMGGFGAAFSLGTLPAPHGTAATDVTGWISDTLAFIMLSSLIVVSLNYLAPRFSASLAQSRELSHELENQRAGLERTVAERTRILARRARYLETTAAVARDAATELDMRELLSRIVMSVSDQFGFYHTGLFLLDSAGTWLGLEAASSQGGQRMLQRKHGLQVGEGIVGYAAQHAECRVALDVGVDAVFFDNPDLPETRSEVALPLQARGDLIGVLDVQSIEPRAFSVEDVTALEALADQVAVAISNARLLAETHQALEAERRAYGETGREDWQVLLRSRSDMRYRYGGNGVQESGEIGESKESGQDFPTIRLPIAYLGQKIGTVAAQKPAGAGEWTEHEIELMEALVEQLSLALDSARLYEDTQRRAARDRLLSTVTTRMRETLDMDVVLQTAIADIGQALNIAEVEVRMGPSPSAPPVEDRSGREAPA